MNTCRSIATVLACVSALLLGTACSPLGKRSSLEGGTDSASRGRILKVTTAPPSLGCKRLIYYSSAYSGVERFLQAKGYPGYLIEDPGGRTRKLIFFYLKSNQAYLMTIKSGLNGAKWTVSGPEPIGKKTRALFEAMDKMQEAARMLAEEAAKSDN